MAAKVNKILIPLTILLIPAYLIRFSVFGIPTNLLEILVLVVFISAFLSKQKIDYKEFYKQNKVYFFGILLVIAGLFISTVVSGHYRIGFGIIKGWFIIPLVFSWVLIKEIKKKEDLENILKWLYLGIFGVAAISLIYYFQGNVTYDSRLKALYLSPNHLAMYLTPGIIIGIYLIQNTISQLTGESYKEMRLLAYTGKSYHSLFFNTISFLIILSSLYLTYSYAAWVAVILSLIITALFGKRKLSKKFVLIGAIIILLIIMSQWNTEKMENLKNFSRSSLESRVIIWQSATKILKDNVIWGIGPGNFQNIYLEYQKYFPPYLEWAVPQPLNLYLAFWLQSGIFGFIGFLILIIKWMHETLKNEKNSLFLIEAVLLGIMLYILIHGFIDTPYWKNDLAVIFWIIFSLRIVASQLKNPKLLAQTS
ncbi:MAG: O-antigen ligase family protein [Candidatus Moranbacteria bacterium]|nr:O-antigen ligase family protein [Candidatus Moranbacteria bacterium]